MKAYVLAAGYATRLWPLTRDTPKPLLEVGGRPILTRIVERLAELRDLGEIVVVGNERFADRFAAWSREVRAPAPLRLLNDGSLSEEDRLGAVGDLAFAVGEVPPGDEDWLVVAGDNLLELDLRALQEEFARQRRPMLVLRDAPASGPSRYNEVTLDDDGRVTRFREKPADPRSGLAAIALYFFTPGVVPLLLRYLEEGGVADAPGHFVEWLVGQAAVGAARLAGEWFDIGTPETLAAARKRFS